MYLKHTSNDIMLCCFRRSPTESTKPSAGEQVLRHYVKEPKQEELLFIDHETVSSCTVHMHSAYHISNY